MDSELRKIGGNPSGAYPLITFQATESPASVKQCAAISHLIFHSFSVYLRHENARRRKNTFFYCTIVQFRCVAQIHFFYFQLNLQLPFINARALNSLLRELFFPMLQFKFLRFTTRHKFSLLLLKSTWISKAFVDARRCNRGEFLLPRFESFVQQH